MALALPSPVHAQQLNESVRVATYNAYLLSPIFKCGHENFANCLTQIVGETDAWAHRLADTILKDKSRFDIIVLNEAWDQDAKKILVQRLSGPQDYPNYVQHIGADLISVRGPALQAILTGMHPAAAVAIYGLPIVKINGEDSGLMLFANSQFEFLPLPDPTHRWGDEAGESLSAQTNEVAFILYEACGSTDCLAAKGVALARLRHKPSGRSYTIVFTHMQADYFDEGELFPDERKAQFEQAAKLIETTLAPLSEVERRLERILLMGDLNVPNFHIPVPPPAITEWDSLFNDTGSYFTDMLYESWARTTSPADQGITNYNDGERLDYILASPRRYESGGLEGPMCVQHMTVPTDFVALESDHNMVHADLNIGFFHCHPQIAHPVKLEKVAFGGKPIEQQIIDDEAGTNITWIAFPGSMQWFHVRKEPGTYTIGTRATGSDPNAVAFDVYLPTDLTTPVSRYYGNGKMVVVREQNVYTETFVLPNEFYIRTRGRDPNFIGDYFLFVKRHTCATKDEACPLQPGHPQSATLTKANSLFGTQDEAWFEFDVIGASDSGAHQKIRLTAAGLPDPANFKASLESFVDTDGSGPPLAQIDGTSRVFADQMGPGSTGYLVIRQAAATANDVNVSASMETSLRILEVLQLVCEDETNPEFGSDDIFTRVTIDGVTKRFPAGGEVEFDCDNSQDAKDWQADFGTPVITFVNEVGLRVIEEDDANPDDPSRFNPVPALPPGQTEFDGRKQPLKWHFEDGSYFLNYLLRMRKNEPVKP